MYGVHRFKKKTWITSSDISLRRVFMVFNGQVFFSEKKFIGVKFIASILEVRKGNEEICSILKSKDGKIGKKIHVKNTYYWCDFLSFISPSGDEYVQLVVTKYT